MVKRNFHFGFTFVELAVLILILASLLLIAFPKFRNIVPQTHLLSSGRRITGVVRRLYYEAAFSKKKCSFTLSIDNGYYILQKEIREGEMEKLEKGTGKLLSGVTFRDVIVCGERIDRGEAHINFLPSGVVEPSIIHLTDSEGNDLSVVVNAFTGKAKLCSGYVEE